MAHHPITVQVTRTIAAPPAVLFDLISDITRMPDWSPETVATRWLDGAAEPVVGARFEGTNVVGRMRWRTRPRIEDVQPGRRFAFRVPGRAGALWSYDLEPVTGGTRVTEAVATGVPVPWLIRLLLRGQGVSDRADHLRDGMTTTLQRLALHAATLTHA